jgi:ABC-type dipeptide/oligopeptide/nickel transport system permease component
MPYLARRKCNPNTLIDRFAGVLSVHTIVIQSFVIPIYALLIFSSQLAAPRSRGQGLSVEPR